MGSRDLKITITKGKGEARTALAAFDASLLDAGIANFNLSYLSSIIPEGSSVVKAKPKFSLNEYGNILYLVIARKNQDVAGKQAWAGIGWVQSKDKKGLFVEHDAESEESVRELIKESLEDMIKNRKKKYGKINYSISGIKCEDKPVCAIVAAVYSNKNWD